MIVGVPDDELDQSVGVGPIAAPLRRANANSGFAFDPGCAIYLANG
jgi:hypothetical protein